MLTYLFELHKGNPLARAEALSIAEQTMGHVQALDAPQDFLLVESARPPGDLRKVLSYTHAIYERVCAFAPEEIKNADWGSYYGTSFCVRSSDKRVVDALASVVWDAVPAPRVQLEGSDTQLFVFFDTVFVLRQRIAKEVCGRTNNTRPVPSPVFFPAPLSKAIINLTRGKTVYDPFCGAGGILVEAGIAGRELKGSDISYSMLKGCEINLRHYGLCAEIFRADATTHVLEEKADAIVCDPPYGNSSSAHGRKTQELYLSFLKNVPNLLRRGGDLVVVFPSFLDYQRIVREAGLFVRQVFSAYVHHHLTRMIVHIVLE